MTLNGNTATIALVEGDEDLLALMQTVLAGPATRLTLAATGRAGMQLYRVQRPDVMILDLALPDMNGWELYMQLQSENGSRPVPLIVLADRASRVDKSFGLQVARVHDFLVKPFLPSQLRVSVAQALQPARPIVFLYAVTQTPA
ncbi:MAG: response regulator [Anaerolineales bacterium]